MIRNVFMLVVEFVALCVCLLLYGFWLFCGLGLAVIGGANIGLGREFGFPMLIVGTVMVVALAGFLSMNDS